MEMKFFDVNVWIGKNAANGKSVDVNDLLCRMEKLNIEKAIVYHILEKRGHPVEVYKCIVDEISGTECLYGIVPILPIYTDEMEKIDFLSFKRDKIVGCTFLSKVHRYTFNTVVLGDILSELERRNFPVFLDVVGEFYIPSNIIDMRDVYNVLTDFPKLTCILYNLGIWNSTRYLWPLLERYENVYLESSMLSLWEGGLEETVKKYGADRVVFGSGFPDTYMESAILKLVNAEISDKDKEKIAYKNMERIIGRIRYE